MKPLLTIDGLSCRYRLDATRTVDVLDDVSLVVGAAETIGIVGESGSGKSTLGLAIPRLLPRNGEIWKGSVTLREQDIGALDAREMQSLRGAEIGMIFQDPFSSFNPTYRIGAQMIDALRAHSRASSEKTGKSELRRRAVKALADVGIPDPDQRIDDFPHQFSGGMLQRAMIATAALLEPTVLIADEPTSALDVSLEVEILRLLERLRSEFGTAIILITHDLLVASEICDRIVVMYAGRIVEEAPIATIFDAPRHPYTAALLRAMPSSSARGETLPSIPGSPPRMTELPPGCKFAPRCAFVADVCTHREPRLLSIADDRVRCTLYDPEAAHSAARMEAAQ